MFRKYSGGMFVPCGTYLNTKDWEFHGVPREGAFLDGDGITYYRVPLLLVMTLGPLIGLAFILFLPVAVPVVVVYGIVRRLTESARERRAREARPAVFSRHAGNER